jgi:hypothetical protein
MDERVSLHTTIEEEYLVRTLEEVAGELEPVMPKGVGLH